MANPQLSTFTKAQYRDRVRGDLGLRSNNLLIDTEINDWGHESQRLVAEATHWLRKSVPANVNSGVAEYDLPLDALAIEEIWHGTTPIILCLTSVRQLQRWDWDWRNVSGTPTHYLLRGMTSIQLYPKPSATITNGLTIHYAYYPAAPATDADKYTVPTVMDKALITYGKLKASEKDATGEGARRVEMYQREWLMDLQKIRQLVGDVAEGELVVLGADERYADGTFDPLWVKGVPII